jgi:RNA polymerase sigma-70 factor (TIGR02960 family)
VTGQSGAQLLLARARDGDGEAFRELVEPHRRELHVHCYRMLGSFQDAEDLLQETLVAAWRGLDRFEARSALRTWLYRIATNRCLNALRTDARRARAVLPRIEVDPPEPTRWAEPSSLEPYPDRLFDGLPDATPGPEARYERKESVSLAFVAATQTLPPQQRAVLVLCDVLGYRAREAAQILDTTESSVTSALKRARATLADAGLPGDIGLPDSPRVRELTERFAEAFASGDADAIVTLLTDDVWLRMPPLPLEYQGRSLVGEFLRIVALRDDRRFRLVPTRANGQPAYGTYLRDPFTGSARAHSLVVLTVSDAGISAITGFVGTGLLPTFGLPETLEN